MGRKLLVTMLVALSAAAVATLGSVGTAGASFPGTNGVIVFSSLRDGNRNIYVHDSSIPAVPGPNEFQITTATGDDFTPVVDPTGTKVGFMSQRKDPPATGTGKARIWTLDLQHSGSTWTGANEADVSGTSPSTPAASQPSWSRDGTKILYTSAGSPHAQIFVMDANGANKHAMLTVADGCDDGQAVWSPVAEKVAYVSNCGAHAQINVVTVDASGNQVGSPISLDQGGASDTKPDWSPDGTTLAFASDASGSSEIYTMNAVDRSARTQLTNDHNDNGEPAWSPDATRVVFSSHLDTTSVVTMWVSAGGGPSGVVTPQTSSNDQPNWASIPGTPPVTPETPMAIALPGVALAAVGGMVWWRRRRSTHSPAAA